MDVRDLRPDVLVSEKGLEPLRLAAGDFKSPVSTIPPLGQLARESRSARNGSDLKGDIFASKPHRAQANRTVAKHVPPERRPGKFFLNSPEI